MTSSLVFLMILDQVRADILYELIRKNGMPYLKKYIFDRAAIVENCFTCFPTNTIPGHLGILTGTYADKHNLPCMRFWNRDKLPFQLRDYSSLEVFNLLRDVFNPHIKMIYEYFAYSEAFTTPNFAKGASYIYLTQFRTIFYYLLQKLSYKPVLFQSLKTFLRRFKRNIKKNIAEILYVLWLPISDLIGHKKGPKSKEFVQHLKEIDRVLFKILFEGYKNWAGLQEGGLLDSTYFIITADHGSFTILNQSELFQDLRTIPLSIKNTQVSLKTQNQSDILVAYTDGFASLYVRNPDSQDWADRVQYSQLLAYPTSKGPLNLISTLLTIPTVSHVFVREKSSRISSYFVFSRAGKGQIQRKFDGTIPLISYEPKEGKDPLGYHDNPKVNTLLDGNFHSFAEWLSALSTTQYPMILDQIPRLFDCASSGDILLMGKEGSSFSQKKEKGTHDTGTYICSRVPLIIAGPSVRKCTIPLARTVDIVPTILSLLKKPVPPNQFDGRILSEIFI
ncbi:MAG: alkaline phosphatase family protein [Candidatus Helarchaeota archaeon]